MRFLRNKVERRQAQHEDRGRPDRARLPIITALLAMLAMLNVASAVLTLMR